MRVCMALGLSRVIKVSNAGIGIIMQAGGLFFVFFDQAGFGFCRGCRGTGLRGIAAQDLGVYSGRVLDGRGERRVLQ